MTKPLTRRWLRWGALLPALLLGPWLVGYTQRQVARPRTIDEMLGGAARGTADPFADLSLVPEAVDWERLAIQDLETMPFNPHVIRVTSKRIEMPVFHARPGPATPPFGDAAGSPDRKGYEPLVVNFIERWVRTVRNPAPAAPPSP
jgi:hypothetical protein